MTQSNLDRNLKRPILMKFGRMMRLGLLDTCDLSANKILWIRQSKMAAAAILKNRKNLNNRPCLLYTSPSPRDRTRSRMPSSA